MIAPTITSAQRKRLQSLYQQYERHTLDAPGVDRASRLQWASQATGRAIASFNDLTIVEAKRLIDLLQGILNVKAPNLSPRRRMSRKDGQKLGTEGRHDQIYDETTLAGPSHFAMIQRDLDDLNWSRERMDNFLFHSTRGPLRGKTQIRTLADVNKAHWAMRRLKTANRKVVSVTP